MITAEKTTVTCGSCEKEADIVIVNPQSIADPRDPGLADEMAWCEHCASWYHRVGCFSLHRADHPTWPVPFSSRRAERQERRRLRWLERQPGGRAVALGVA